MLADDSDGPTENMMAAPSAMKPVQRLAVHSVEQMAAQMA